MALFRLLRVLNLLIVALTQFFVHHRVIAPALALAEVTPVLNQWYLVELIITTVIVTAGGYLVNDFFDYAIDRVNRPHRLPISDLSLSVVKWLYLALLLGGFILSTLLAMRLHEMQWLWLYPIASLLLALYSPVVKRYPLVANLVVAVYCAGVAGLLWLAERRPLARLAEVDASLYAQVTGVLIVFMVFAFGATLLRELVKDLEDMEGDRLQGRRTLPLLLGAPVTRFMSLVVGLLLLVSLAWPLLAQWTVFSPLLLRVGLIGLMVWLVIMLLLLLRARQSRDYHRLSEAFKLFMVAGVILLLLVRFS